MSVYQDSKGLLWFGCAGGLFRLDGDRLMHIGIDGPWE